MIEKDNPKLSIGKQCKLLSISRSSFYYQPKGETALNLMLMRKIDKQFLETPFYGVQQMTWHLRNDKHLVNEKRVRRLMRLMGLMPIYQKPNTSKAAKGHKIYPYLLRGLRVDRPNQVWAADITYIPMRRGFLYLVAIIDWFTRKVLAWRLSNTLEADFCVDALNEAIAKYDPPEIMNTDQAASSHPSPGQIACADLACVSRWMAKDASWTTSLLSGSGGASNTNASICTLGKPDHRPGRASESGLNFTITNDHTAHMLENRLHLCTAQKEKKWKPISRCKK